MPVQVRIAKLVMLQQVVLAKMFILEKEQHQMQDFFILPTALELNISQSICQVGILV
jgi:hypothetical protein